MAQRPGWGSRGEQGRGAVPPCTRRRCRWRRARRPRSRAPAA